MNKQKNNNHSLEYNSLFNTWLFLQKNRSDYIGDFANYIRSDMTVNEYRNALVEFVNDVTFEKLSKCRDLPSFLNWLESNGVVKTKQKYFAYLHRNNHVVIKPYIGIDHFMEYVHDGLDDGSMVMGVFSPFVIERFIALPAFPTDGLQVINLSKIQSKPKGKNPVLHYIKAMIEKIDWMK